MNSIPKRRPFAIERRNGRSSSNESVVESAELREIAALREEISLLRAEISTMQQSRTEPSSTAAPAPAAGRDEIQAVQLEITQLVKSIAKAKQEIAAIKHPMADDDRLIAASNELDAIVCATEAATCDILDAAERIEKEAVNLAALCHDDTDVVPASEKIVGEVIRIMEASNFQDITGQRITKVVEIVRFIEQRVLAMIDIWGVDAFAEMPIQTEATGTEADLLNGPQLENQGISQADIDALFD